MTQGPEETPASGRRRPGPGNFYGYWERGDFVAVCLFAATLIAAATAWEWLPTALALLSGQAGSEASRTVHVQFLVVFAVVVAAPVGGWLLWRAGRYRWALATLILLGLALWMMSSAR